MTAYRAGIQLNGQLMEILVVPHPSAIKYTFENDPTRSLCGHSLNHKCHLSLQVNISDY